uniref:AlNc14C38G3331 protein n=1 Tax=Albugo laibachii Nc14 TaxID=890382 RepID=F0W964_9STRA|nr:AlNc14C38G3331 [Albugo laibachii Nc14]|eukprot:CCA17677.1 AlNc14C38G3331 [Albugo laibachii Nc14]
MVKSLRLEAARFGVYLAIPAIASFVYSQPDCIHWIVTQWQYIRYPPQEMTRDEFERAFRKQVDAEKAKQSRT